MIWNLISKAKDLFYNNEKSGLSAKNVQNAIDELNTNLTNTNNAFIEEHTVTYENPIVFYSAACDLISSKIVKYGKIAVFTCKFTTNQDYQYVSGQPLMRLADEYSPYDNLVAPVLKAGYGAIFNAELLTNGNIILPNNSLDANLWYVLTAVYITN